MNPVIAVLLAEQIKWRRSWALLTSILIPVSQVLFLFLVFWFSEDRVNRIGPGFHAWIKINYSAWNLFFLPVSTVLVPELSWAVEEEAGAWKHLLTQPVHPWAHYASKLVSHFALLLLSQVLLASLVLGGGLLLRGWVPVLEMGPAPVGSLVQVAFLSILASLPLVILHTWISTRLRGFGAGLAIALGGIWGTFQLAQASWVTTLIPWGLASHVASIFGSGKAIPWTHLLGGMTCAMVLVFVGGLDFRSRRELRA